MCRDCFLVFRFKINISQFLVVVKKFYLKNSKKHIDIKRKNKKEVGGVHDDASAFIEKHNINSS